MLLPHPTTTTLTAGTAPPLAVTVVEIRDLLAALLATQAPDVEEATTDPVAEWLRDVDPAALDGLIAAVMASAPGIGQASIGAAALAALAEVRSMETGQ